MNIVPGLDVSRYQGTVDWKAVADAGFRFAVIRATIWDVKVDETFETNWTGARNAGLLVSAYHVLKADVPAAAQIDFFARALTNHEWDLPPVLDIELAGTLTTQQITQSVRECLRLSEQRFGRKPIVYTGKWFWDSHVMASGEWAQYDLWAASYGTSNPVLPASWIDWKIWQYTSTGYAPSIANYVDMNWFNGSYDDLLKYCSAPIPQPSGQRAKAKVSLNIRNGAGINFQNIGNLPSGSDVIIDRVDGTDVWVQIDTNKWIALAYKGDRYAQSETSSDGLQVRIITDILNVRSGPGVEQPVVGQLKKNAVAPLKEVDGKDVWGEFAPGQWIAIAFRGDRYVEFS